MHYLLFTLVLTLALPNNTDKLPHQASRAIHVDYDYLEGCETGVQCKPIMISRKAGEAIELVLPKLYRSSVTLWDEVNFSKFKKQMKPYQALQTTGSGDTGEAREVSLPLSGLKDGTYHIWIAGDSVGGFFQIQIKTE